MPFTYRHGVYGLSTTYRLEWLHENIMGKPPSPGMLVRHKNGNVYDNGLENLEWCWPSEPDFVFLTEEQLRRLVQNLKEECLDVTPRRFFVPSLFSKKATREPRAR